MEELLNLVLAPAAPPEAGCLTTPEQFGERLRREPPARLELPDRVVLTGASLAAFLESGHFPFGRYRVEEEWFFVTPSLHLDLAALEEWVRSGPGERPVGQELLVWRRASFHVAAGTASEARNARPFVGPSGARAYVWLGRTLPGGPLLLRDANNVEERVPVPEGMGRGDGATGRRGDGATGRRDGTGRASDAATPLAGSISPRPSVAPSPRRPVAPSPRPIHPHPALLRAEEALGRGGDPAVVERCLREVMASPGAGGEALARAGQLWQALGRQEVAGAAYQMALERGCIEGALGLSHLAETRGEGVEASAHPLDAAISRNLRSPELHARYAELLARVGHGRLAEWHRRQANELKSVMSDE